MSQDAYRLISPDGTESELPSLSGTTGPDVIDISRLYGEQGVFTYDPGFSTVSTPLAEVLSSRRGVCQDFAHLGIACLRSLGLAARYVSGYLYATDASAGDRPEDDEVDALYNQVYRELLTFMFASPNTIDQATYLIWAAHNLERAADRVTNICERVVFTVTGEMAEMDVQEGESHTLQSLG
mgnify:CR=1 FL=1